MTEPGSHRCEDLAARLDALREVLDQAERELLFYAPRLEGRLVEDPAIHRTVAVKTLRLDFTLGSNKELRERFFAAEDGAISYALIPPRHMESAALRSNKELPLHGWPERLVSRPSRPSRAALVFARFGAARRSWREGPEVSGLRPCGPRSRIPRR